VPTETLLQFHPFQRRAQELCRYEYNSCSSTIGAFLSGRKYAMLKLKILLAQIVRNFKIKSVVPEKDFQLQADIILKRADGFRVILEERV
jgi:hypothetical protein